jgi:hypothetical protein
MKLSFALVTNCFNISFFEMKLQYSQFFFYRFFFSFFFNNKSLSQDSVEDWKNFIHTIITFISTQHKLLRFNFQNKYLFSVSDGKCSERNKSFVHFLFVSMIIIHVQSWRVEQFGLNVKIVGKKRKSFTQSLYIFSLIRR